MLRKSLTILALLALSLGTAQGKTTFTRGYIKKNGTYVAPAAKTSPNRTKLDNWSTKGNSNPFTGKKGTKNPFGPH
jgi:hypothetical protein